jgi:polyphenol oxidase
MAAADIELIRPDWPAPANVHAVATTRVGGYSSGPYASLNLGTHVGDDPQSVERNRLAVSHVLEVRAVTCWLDQVHGARIIAVPSSTEGAPVTQPVAADASITSATGMICAIMTADCLPVLFTDRNGRHVAAVHGGWRGLVAGILENTISAFAARGVSPGELCAWLGPAISPFEYEVDAAVVKVLRGDDQAALTPAGPEHWQLDLYKLARLRLAGCGVNAVFGGEFCTFAESERFFSYRRDGVCGRQATLIWME